MLVRHGNFSFKCFYNGHRNNILILGDSLLKTLYMGEVDFLCFPGARSDDVLEFLNNREIRNIVRRYDKIVLFFGGNSVNDFPKQGVLRQAERPSEVFHNFVFIIEQMKTLRNGVKIGVLGCPNRFNGTWDRIKELNELLRILPCEYRFFGLGTKLSCKVVIDEDQVHLNQLGVTCLKSIIKHKIVKW